MYLTKYPIHDLKIYTYLGIFIVSRKWNEMSGPDLRRRVQVARYLQPFSKRKKNEKKTGDNIYLSIGDVSGPRQPKCHRSKRRERERERFLFVHDRTEEAVGRVSCPWNRVNQRKRGTDRNRIGRCFRGSCRGEIKRAKADVRDDRAKGEDQILDAAVAALKGEPATTAAFRQDRKYAEFMDARVPPPPRNWRMASYVRPCCLSSPSR